MSDPLVPNFKKGVGRLATDRYDFEDHIEGNNFRHKANQIDLVPTVVVGAVTETNVQNAIARLATLIATPVIPDATSSTKGIIQLAGDLNASISGGTAANPKVTGIQGFPIANTAPTINYVLTWTGSTWSPSPVISSFTAATDLAGNSVSQTVIGLTGTGAPPNATINAKCDIIQFISNATPTITQTAATSGNGINFLLRAQAGFAGSGRGGSVIIRGGADGASSVVNAGAAFLLGDGTYMAEAVGVNNGGNGSKVLSLLGNAAITSTQMPANTGSRVIYISDTSTPPTTGSPVSGAILYSSAGQITIKQSDGQNFAISADNYYVPTFTVTSDRVVSATDYVLFVDTTSPHNITLPVPSNGRTIIIKDIIGNASAANISLLQHSTEKIEGLAATKVFSTNFGAWTVVSNGTDWFLV